MIPLQCVCAAAPPVLLKSLRSILGLVHSGGTGYLRSHNLPYFLNLPVCIRVIAEGEHVHVVLGEPAVCT